MAQPIWTTPVGTLGNYPYNVLLRYQLIATPVAPATSIVGYAIISGTLSSGLSMDELGLIYGTPSLVPNGTVSAFTVRVTDNLGNIRDRTFSIEISASLVPQFTTPEGILISTQDSVWTSIQLEYSNPDPTNEVAIELQEGILPPGLEISRTGLIQGYAQPPTISTTIASVSTVCTLTDAATDSFSVLNISGITPGRPVVFTDSVFGDVLAGQTYYINTVDVVANTFTISVTQEGDVFPVINGSGAMTVTLPAISVGQPTIRTYSFILKLISPLGTDISSYAITVINQNTPVSQGGPGKQTNTRIPTILNTRPLTIEIDPSNVYYGYYILPPVSPSSLADIGTILSDNFFSFKFLGYDFDGNELQYLFSNLPSWLSGNSSTGWITGTPELPLAGINMYSFNVSVRKASNPAISTPNFNFAFYLSKDVTGQITWVTPSNMGEIFNETISTLNVVATSDVPLSYRITEGTLPPNLILLSNGEITGYVASQPTDVLLDVGTSTEFTFTVEAFSTEYAIVNSSKTFTLTVVQEYQQPTDTLYIKAAPSLEDREILRSLLNNETLIPSDYLYRSEDIYFGKASSVIYEHAYGIFASNIQAYLDAVTRNHYWRNITLGELKTAVAKNDAGDIIYEVVYSEVIDNLVNSAGVSVSSQVSWPRPINLNLGPYYTSVTNIFASWEQISGQDYYTSLSPGSVRTLYPNSLYNMRNRVGQVLGQEFDSRLLPLWMTSQQSDGSTLGYTQAWVICYTKPGYSETIKNNIQNPDGTPASLEWPFTLNKINFKIDRFSVGKSTTYNYDNTLTPPAWIGLPSADPVPDPIDSKDFYVLFPRQTILPNTAQN